MTRRVVEKLCTKKVCVDFLAPTDLLEFDFDFHILLEFSYTPGANWEGGL